MTVSGQDTIESCFNAQCELVTDQLTEIQLGLELQGKTTEKQISQTSS